MNRNLRELQARHQNTVRCLRRSLQNYTDNLQAYVEYIWMLGTIISHMSLNVLDGALLRHFSWAIPIA